MSGASTFENQLADLYTFFVDAETHNEDVTYKEIQGRLSRSYTTVRWYVNNFWSWFLHTKEEKRGRYKVFICHGIAGYPKSFFVEAHKKKQGQYFYHFAGALIASKKRAEDHRQQMEQGEKEEVQSSKSLEVQPPGVEQDVPEELNIADNEGGEDESEDETEGPEEYSESSESTDAPSLPGQDTSPPAETEETTRAIVSLSPSQPSSQNLLQRIMNMLGGLSVQDRALLENLIGVQNEFRNELRREIQGLKQALLNQASGSASITQDVQTLAKEQEAFRAEITGKVATLIQEVRQYLHPDLSSIRADIGKQTNQLTQVIAAIEQIPTAPDVTAIGDEIEEVLKNYAIAQRLQDISERISELRKQVTEPAWLQVVNDHIAALQEQVTEPAWLPKTTEGFDTLQLRLNGLQQQVAEPAWLQAVKDEFATLQKGVIEPAWLKQATEEIESLQRQIAALERLLTQRYSEPLKLDKDDIQGSIDEATEQANEALSDTATKAQAAIALLRETYLARIDDIHQYIQTVEQKHEKGYREMGEDYKAMKMFMSPGRKPQNGNTTLDDGVETAAETAEFTSPSEEDDETSTQ